LEQNLKTKKFITAVNSLIDKGAVKNFTEIIDNLEVGKSVFSNIINGRRNVPHEVYTKFSELYGIDDTDNGLELAALVAMVRGLKNLCAEHHAKIYGVSFSQASLEVENILKLAAKQAAGGV